MKKRLLTLSLLCALSVVGAISITSCGDTTGSNTTVESNKKTLLVTLEGEKSVGQIIIINVKDQDGNVVENAKIEILEGKEFITIDGNKISLNGKGHVKIQISKEGYNSYETEFDINEAVLLKLNVSFEGKLFHGETIKTVVKDENGLEITDFKIDIRKGGDFAQTRGNDIILLDKGTVAGIISKDGYEETPFEFESKEVLRIKDIKDNVDNYNGKLVTVRGIVTASYGNTFYLMDGKNGFYVYNMNRLETAGNPGDGFENGRVVMNKAVLVTAQVDNGNYGLQLAGNVNGSFIEDACVLKSNMDVQKPLCYEVKKEADIIAYNASPKLAGSRIKITGKYITGDFSSAEQTGAKDAIFNFTYGSTNYQAKFNKYGNVSTVKSYWNKQKIEAGDYVTLEGNFTNYRNTVSIDLTDEGTIIHNESKDINNIICVASNSKVAQDQTITLSATLPEGLTGTPTFEIIKGNEFATLEGNTLKGIKPGQVTIVAKVGDKVSMPIEIIVTEGEYSSISSIRTMETGAEVTAAGKILGFYRDGVLIQDNSGYLFCKTEDDYYPQGIKIGDYVAASGTTITYVDNARKFPSISDSKFKVLDKKEIATTYTKVNQSDFKNFTDGELKNGKAIEVELTVDKFIKKNGIPMGKGYFTLPDGDEPGTEYYFLGYDNSLYLKPLESSNVKAIVYGTYSTKINKKGYIIMVTEATKKVTSLENITLELAQTIIDNNLDGSKYLTTADITVGPIGASKDGIKLVVVEGDASLVYIDKSDFFHDFKIKSTGTAGVVKLQAQSADGSIKSNIVELTIKQYVIE